NRGALELPKGLDQRLLPLPRSRTGSADAVPCGQEPAQRCRVDRLHLFAERGERAPSEHPEHVDLAPLPLQAARAELPEYHSAVALQGLQRARRAVEREPVPARELRGEERAVRTAEPGDEAFEPPLA